MFQKEYLTESHSESYKTQNTVVLEYLFIKDDVTDEPVTGVCLEIGLNLKNVNCTH